MFKDALSSTNKTRLADDRVKRNLKPFLNVGSKDGFKVFAIGYDYLTKQDILIFQSLQ
jgi:hypothetical protein